MAIQHDAIDRDAVTGANAQPIAQLHKIERDHLVLARIGDPPCRLGREVE